MLRESPSLEWGLVPTLLSLSGIRIQPFWGIENVQTPFLLGLCCPEYQAGPFQWAELCQPCTESSRLAGILPCSCRLASWPEMIRLQLWGSSPVLCLLASEEAEEPRAPASPQGCCGCPVVLVPHPSPCPSLCSCMWMLHVRSGAWMLHCPTACPFW